MVDIKNLVVNELNNELIYQKGYRGNNDLSIYMNTRTNAFFYNMFNRDGFLESDGYDWDGYDATYKGIPICIDLDMMDYKFECR